MTTLHAALVTPLTGPLASCGQACVTGLTQWAKHAALLPPPWTGVDLDVRETGSDVGTSISAGSSSRD
jgi:branched-chain amino acid transport system substrate-binding protein